MVVLHTVIGALAITQRLTMDMICACPGFITIATTIGADKDEHGSDCLIVGIGLLRERQSEIWPVSRLLS